MHTSLPLPPQAAASLSARFGLSEKRAAEILTDTARAVAQGPTILGELAYRLTLLQTIPEPTAAPVILAAATLLQIPTRLPSEEIRRPGATQPDHDGVTLAYEALFPRGTLVAADGDPVALVSLDPHSQAWMISVSPDSFADEALALDHLEHEASRLSRQDFTRRYPPTRFAELAPGLWTVRSAENILLTLIQLHETDNTWRLSNPPVQLGVPAEGWPTFTHAKAFVLKHIRRFRTPSLAPASPSR